jgi:hypothetical protein
MGVFCCRMNCDDVLDGVKKNWQEIWIERCRVYEYMARRICLGETTFKTGTRFKWVHSLEDVLRSFGVTLPHLVVALPLPLPFYGQTFRRERKQSVSYCSLRTYMFWWSCRVSFTKKSLVITEVDKLALTFALGILLASTKCYAFRNHKQSRWLLLTTRHTHYCSHYSL